jgi:nucleoside-diphosphate-sugar epimerase
MDRKKVIVTGGAGFIGRHALAGLLALGYEVHSVSRGGLDQELNRLKLQHNGKLTQHKIDLGDSAKVTALLKEVRATHLLHLAWDTRHGIFWSSLDNLSWVANSAVLLRAFIENGGQRAVGAGTCAEYRWGGSDDLKEGVSEICPQTIYGCAKAAFHNLLAKAAVEYKVSAAWGRVFFLFGPYEDRKRLIPAAIISLLKGEPFKASDGAQLRDFSYVEDVAGGFVALLESGVEGEVNISSGKEISIANILELLGKLTKRSDLIRFGEYRAPQQEAARIVANTARLNKEVNFTITAPVEQRLSQTVDWWRSQPDIKTLKTNAS